MKKKKNNNKIKYSCYVVDAHHENDELLRNGNNSNFFSCG